MERTDLLSMLQDNRNQTKKKRNAAAEQVKTERSTKASGGTAASRAAAPSHCMSLRSPRPSHGVCLGHDSNTKQEAGFKYPGPDLCPKAHITMTLF